MYQPPHFIADDLPQMLAFLAAHPLGLLVTRGEGVPVVDAVPFRHVPEEAGFGRLEAHVARANPLWRLHDPAEPVVVVFQGPEHYVSPGWYATKAETGKVVPTWNYSLVQATGRLVVHDDPVWVRGQIERLTAAHESGRPAPWAVGDAPDAFIAAQLRGIVGIEVRIDALVGKFKLSQNRNPADRSGVIAGLDEEATAPAAAVAALMRGPSAD
ncbi:FMN-binding negative transcriptional regulator [Methylobrevis albus]|uniref:FMN-binding negative transcriptional regulator n=1 Tax=Methylobrevis albus TaxID=2793297 RepID=A0A931MYN1_9HYPH|nr:FMN-binding negative transcriptional regulator [Methylobrevis albus]MBH0237189.1 FMN-binding negative transcriptional regulator [Methylobrevis albus]